MRRHLWAAAQFGAGNAIYLLFSALWTFELPRQITVERFADWRLFFLFNSFLGALPRGALDAMPCPSLRRRSARPTPNPLRDVRGAAVLALLVGAPLGPGSWC